MIMLLFLCTFAPQSIFGMFAPNDLTVPKLEEIFDAEDVQALNHFIVATEALPTPLEWKYRDLSKLVPSQANTDTICFLSPELLKRYIALAASCCKKEKIMKFMANSYGLQYEGCSLDVYRFKLALFKFHRNLLKKRREAAMKMQNNLHARFDALMDAHSDNQS